MKLIIDVGNTRVKLAVYNGSHLEERLTTSQDNLFEQICMLVERYKSITGAIMSSVGGFDDKVISKITELVNLMILNSKTKLPFENKYKTPSTLGVDRIALVSASVNQFPNDDVLIIDAGTCVTYDFINSSNEYIGGAISPGLSTRYRSLNNLTANLPLLDLKLPENITGNSTNESIHSGVVNGLVKEIDGVITEYKIKYPHLTVILTGGDANFLSKQLKSSIFANSNFLLEGLNFLLQFNSNE
ncbi:type III pantothenate kinase [Seonamhaeicola sp. ML3]|uniref:type III pantothenate kinase n=1 Tax=Seonamhaeicola sp. ML3 TaxID=2937786 RepID=UPI00201058AC|nr:type III pantothenate kinase [Seonamhaeicola sp. ML3]